MTEYWISKVEVFKGLALKELKEALNNFNKEHFVVATTCYPYKINDYTDCDMEEVNRIRVYDAIVYYKVPPNKEED